MDFEAGVLVVAPEKDAGELAEDLVFPEEGDALVALLDGDFVEGVGAGDEDGE